MNGSGDFVVARATDDGGGTTFNWSIRARRYNAAGAPQGDEIRANTDSSFFQFTPPGAAIDPAGNLVIAWDRNGGGGVSVRAQRFAVVAQIKSSAFLFNTAPHRLAFNFDRDVAATLDLDDLIVHNLTTGQTLPPGAFAIAYDPVANTATFTYTGGTGVLDDGIYRATLLAAGIHSPQGAPLADDHVLDFRFLRGDANNDGRVNLADFNILAANFGQSPRTFSQGDFNYDGTVNLSDFNVLAGRFGQVVAPDAPLARQSETDDPLNDLLA